MYLARQQGGFGSYNGILDSVLGDASVALARGINDGVVAVLPEVQRRIQEVIDRSVNVTLPIVQTRLTTAITEGLTQGAQVAKAELASTTSELLPALQASVVAGGTKIVDKYKPWLIAVGALVGVAAVATVILQYEQVRLLKGKSRSTGSLAGRRSLRLHGYGR